MIYVCACVLDTDMAEAGVDLSRKFVSESEIEERKRRRQEEWEKVRKPDDPQGEFLSSPRVALVARQRVVLHQLFERLPCLFFLCLEAPEEEYDPRSLFERLQEQKEKKQEEYEEQFKFSEKLLLFF